jgi:hypothetical protein
MGFRPLVAPDRVQQAGGDWSLVASLVFKTMDASKRRVVGSIPIHLRQQRQPAGHSTAFPITMQMHIRGG